MKGAKGAKGLYKAGKSAGVAKTPAKKGLFVTPTNCSPKKK